MVHVLISERGLGCQIPRARRLPVKAGFPQGYAIQSVEDKGLTLYCLSNFYILSEADQSWEFGLLPW